jgi:predicted nucleic acid binding AN1-type Zn finger protein
MYSTGEELFFSAAKLVFGFTVLQAYIAQTVETVDCLSVVCHYSTAFSSFTGNRGKVYFSAEHTGPRSHLYFILSNCASAGTPEIYFPCVDPIARSV